jgi:hypothetical protein
MKERQEEAAKRAIAFLIVNWTAMSSCDGDISVRQQTSVKQQKNSGVDQTSAFKEPIFWTTW